MLYSPLHQCLEGWWNIARVETVLVFSQTHCLYGLPTVLQGGLKPYYTIPQIISVVYVTPNRGKWNVTILWAMKLGKNRPVPQAWLGGSNLSWVSALRDQISYHGVVHSPVNCWIASLSFSYRWKKDDISWETREVKEPLSLTNIVGCDFYISVHLQISVVLIMAKHSFPPPSSRVNQ